MITNPEAKRLRDLADEAKYQYAIGAIDYDELVKVATAYIDLCNQRAVAIAKEYGMRPKKMHVKAFLR